MSSRFFVVTSVLLAVVASLASGQNPPTNNGKPIPDYVLYNFFFFHVTWADRQAGKMASRGMDDAIYRTLVRREVGLTAKEEAMVKAIAADWRQKDSQLLTALTAIQAARASGVQANSQEVQNLESQRIQTVRDHISQLQAGFGNMRFQVLDAFVRKAPTVKPPDLPSPPRGPAKK
jgi:hypothetical protein